MPNLIGFFFASAPSPLGMPSAAEEATRAVEVRKVRRLSSMIGEFRLLWRKLPASMSASSASQRKSNRFGLASPCPNPMFGRAELIARYVSGFLFQTLWLLQPSDPDDAIARSGPDPSHPLFQ